VLSTVTDVGTITIDLLVVLVLTYFFAADSTLGSHLLKSVTPEGYQLQAVELVARLRFRLTRWIWAQLAIAVYFVLAFGSGATLLGVPFALTIALVGGVLEIIPYVGGAVALTLAAFSALTVSPWLAVWVLILFIVIAEVESHIVAPAFYGRAMDLHPAVVLVAMLVGAKVGGLVGVFFAVPVTVVLVTLWEEWRAVKTMQTL
jgi:predicted PurR-regulated permease PerM